MTVEPGIYIVPALLADRDLRARHRHAVDWDRAERLLDVGGIRIEDDVLITEDGYGVHRGRARLRLMAIVAFATAWEKVRAPQPELVAVAPCGSHSEVAAQRASQLALDCLLVAVDADSYFRAGHRGSPTACANSATSWTPT